MSLCIETSSLSHRYKGQELVVDDLNLQVPKGAIYGFLGPNGAGKTTTLKLLLGLIQAQKGDIFLFGKKFPDHRIECLRRIGSLIESPSIYGHLTAQENMRVWKPLYGCSEARIGEVLTLVGLAHTKNKKANQFSLGMKQRLAIAASLLNSPDLLILDEPTNGLDPQGIIEMRALLRRLNEEHGVTIIVSSHLLTEVEKLVSHIGIIHQGKLKFQGTWAELQALQKAQQAIIWRTSDLKATRDIIRNGQQTQSNIICPWIPQDDVARINEKIISSGIQLYEVSYQAPDLESIFLQMIHNA